METQVSFPGFSELTIHDDQPIVINTLGRTAQQMEYVFLEGYHGNVMRYSGIADGAQGHININHRRTIRTTQIDSQTTFITGSELWFVSGGSTAAGQFTGTDPGSGDRIAAGRITGFGGSAGAHTYVEFRPYVQRVS